MAAVARSYLYVPGDRADLLDKAAGRGADALVLDLEDAVTPARKAHARETVAGYLGAAAPAGPELWVRINSDQVAADVEVLSPAAAGVWVPKAEPELLAEVDAALTRVQRRIGPDAPAFRVVALIETARGVLTAPRVAEAPRVLRLGLGEADLAGELGLQPGPERAEFAPIRSQVVVASAAAGITPPVGPVETTLRDPERLELTTRALLRQGFRARSAIHPGQIATINEVFTPTEAEVASARAVLAALERAERGGSGVATDADGRLLDRAVVRAAAEVVRRAEASTD
ncbi:MULTISPECIES: HpcH/HpaI aldolase/citrate lyase family protein [Micromonospora]|uniref:HpcH/HpaI aldolase/citrate lyase family protein n=1 Tax=Micromonospora TaxID=1873 RepID=UPI001AE3EE20|nr:MULTISPECIES: CoA ester lyase [unclassified Micromonospora]MBP1784069.1 citrate lyase subunit beta/citryl-CoA lyase [Micromonospora sp. HB375]MDH6467061.1 citrate lyase subunit beta/citryl-CoA lyase [Micromonospora sp. H404/HB375]